jgi:hypothetical protein
MDCCEYLCGMLRWGGGQFIPYELLSSCLRHHDLVFCPLFQFFPRMLTE